MVNTQTEENNYPKAIVISLALMGVFLLVSFFWYVSRVQYEEIGTGGIIVNYGTSDVGSGNDYMNIEEPSMDPNANAKNPDKISQEDPQPNTVTENSDKNLATQDFEDAPAVENSTKKSTAAPTVKPDKPSTKPTVNPNALYKGARNNATGQGDGNDGVPGNKGDKDGDPLSREYGSGGSGFGTLSPSLASRRFVQYPTIQDDGRQDGTVAVEIRVRKDGSISNARVVPRGTTIADRELWTKCEQAMRGARLNQLETAADEQVGTMVFRFKNN